MSNVTHFVQFYNKKTLIIESYYELVEMMTLIPEWIKSFKIFFLISIGWLIGLITVIITIYCLPITNRKPNQDIFFAAYEEKIRKTFRHQTKETFQTIVMGTNRIFKENTEDSTVFMMLVPQGAMTTAVRLVTLLVHCILVAYQLPATQHHIRRVISYGYNYTSNDDGWLLFLQIKHHLRFYGVAALLSVENLHPQAVRTLQMLVPQTHAPAPPQAVLILVVDLRNRFTEHEKKTLSPKSLGKIFLQETLEPYFDQSELVNTINRLGSRCIFVNPEPDY